MRAGLISGKTRPARPRLGPDDHTHVATASPRGGALITPPSTIVVRVNVSSHPTSIFTAIPSDATSLPPPEIIEVCLRVPSVTAKGYGAHLNVDRSFDDWA